MKKQIVFATGNEGKMREIRAILEDTGCEILSMKEAGIVADILEDGTTFEENALIKAKAVAEYTDAIVLADDSGLEIDYLNKEPGIYSARYLGEDTSYRVKNQNLIDRLAGVPDEKRTARFVCVISYIDSNGNASVMRGECEGFIGKEMKGDNGFGYDPIFMIGDRSFAEISSEEKNTISHRANALKKLTEKLKGEKYDNNKAES